MGELPEFGGAARDALLWGTYRPGAFVGLRQRRPQGLVAGLMWSQRGGRADSLRNEATGEVRFGWERHDGRTFGEQAIVDGDIRLDVSFLKGRADSVAQDWVVRVSGTPQEGGKHHVPDVAEQLREVEGFDRNKYSLMFYVGDEDSAAVDGALPWQFGVPGEEDVTAGGPVQLVSGSNWRLDLGRGGDKGGANVTYFGTAAEELHKVHDFTKAVSHFEARRDRDRGQWAPHQLPNTTVMFQGVPETRKANLAVFQVSVDIRRPFTYDFVFTSSPGGGCHPPQGGPRSFPGQL